MTTQTKSSVIAEEAMMLSAENRSLRAALAKIERWFGEFPETGEKWPDGTPVSYGASLGSNGERDFMRGVARRALNNGETSNG